MDGRDHLLPVEITLMLLTLMVGVMMGKWCPVSFCIYQSSQFSTALHGCHTIRLTSSLYERPLIQEKQRERFPLFFGWEIEVCIPVGLCGSTLRRFIEPKFYKLLYKFDLK